MSYLNFDLGIDGIMRQINQLIRLFVRDLSFFKMEIQFFKG